MTALLGRLSGIVLPVWAKWVALAALVIVAYGGGRVHEARRAVAVLADYIGKQAAQTVRIIERQAKTDVLVQTKYVDRIQKIYVQGVTIETNIPNYIQPFDTERFGVNAGFLRVVDAAWSGDAVGPAADSDREPAGIPLDDVALAQVANATSCRAWREQALGWREYYARKQVDINGEAGAWYQQDSDSDSSE
ncbi:hypothetical protein ACFSQU_18185 [Massilia sp. GCM10020059]|uniref:Uncharacterized protein n=1 Tax=Massilia agrisoli TaxID=2892444 RepID=A0ABS8IUI2_9BURK|nr:hypothetical protein [Massilia agrisoli]MCC6071472.1 hypothetical protein [Massilia agrisoli]